VSAIEQLRVWTIEFADAADEAERRAAELDEEASSLYRF